MKRSVKLVAVLLAMVMMLGVSVGCAGKAPGVQEGSVSTAKITAKKQYTIALSLKTVTNNDFQKILADSFKKYVEESGNKFVLVLAGEELAVSAQVSEIEDLIAQKVDCIVINPMDALAVIPAMKKAKAAGIPVFVIDSMIAAGNEDLFVAFVGTDNFNAGVDAGKRMINLLGGKGNVILVRGANGSKSGDDRMDGFKKGIEGSELKIVGEQPGNWKNDTAMLVTENMLQGQKQVDGLFCASDGMLDGILSAIKDNKRDGIKIISVDGTKKSVDYIKDGSIVGTIAQFPDKICKLTVEYAVKHLGDTSGTINKNTDSGTIFLDKSNPTDWEKYAF